MSETQAATCVHTGRPAYAELGRLIPGMVSGWYGSTVVDGPHALVTLDPTLPEGPVCDAVLTEWLDSGKAFDPETIRNGQVDIRDVSDAVVSAIVDAGARLAIKYLDEDPGAPLTFGVMWQENHEYMAFPFVDALMGGGRLVMGPDLLGVGRLMALVTRARGRIFEDADRRASIVDFVESVRAKDRMLNEILDDATKPDQGPKERPTWLLGVLDGGGGVDVPPLSKAGHLRMLVHAGRLAEIDEFLTTVPIHGETDITLVAMLRTTYELRGSLNAWEDLLEEVARLFDKRGSDTARLLAGLMPASPQP